MRLQTETFLRRWEFPLIGIIRETHLVLQKSGYLDYIELVIILARAVKGEHFATRTEKSNFFGNLLDKEVENLEDHSCLKVQYLVDKETWICSCYTLRNKIILHCAARNAKFFGNVTSYRLKL